MGEARDVESEASRLSDAFYYARQLLRQLESLSKCAQESTPAEWSIVEPQLQEAAGSWYKLFIALNTQIHRYDEDCTHGKDGNYSDDCELPDYIESVRRLYPAEAITTTFQCAGPQQYATALEAMEEVGHDGGCRIGFYSNTTLRDHWNSARHLFASMASNDFGKLRVQLDREATAHSAQALGIEPRIVAPTQKLQPHDLRAFALCKQHKQTEAAKILSKEFRREFQQCDMSKSKTRVTNFIVQVGRLPEVESAEPRPRQSTMNNLDGIAQTTETVPGNSPE